MQFRSAIILGLLAFALSTHGQQFAITFDDLPAHGPLPADETRLQIAQSILATIQREKLPPTYGFINGVRIAEDPSSADVLKAWATAGNPLGNHTYTHANLNKLTPEQFEAEIQQNEPLLKQYAANYDWRWLRYPFLAEGDTPEKARAIRTWLSQRDYKIAEVNMSFGDYLWNEPYARCAAKHDEPAIKQLHDLYLSAAEKSITASRQLAKEVYGRDIPYVLLMHIGAFDARMFPELVALYRARGFAFVTLPDAEKDPAFHDDAYMGMASGAGHLGQIAAQRRLPYPHMIDYSKTLDSICR